MAADLCDGGVSAPCLGRAEAVGLAVKADVPRAVPGDKDLARLVLRCDGGSLARPLAFQRFADQAVQATETPTKTTLRPPERLWGRHSARLPGGWLRLDALTVELDVDVAEALGGGSCTSSVRS